MEPVTVGNCVDVLEKILPFCELDTLKTARLVNKTWLDVANKQICLQINEYVHKEWMTTETLENVAQLRCVGEPQCRLLDIFGNTLKHLELKDMWFRGFEDFESVIFQDFPNLNELKLGNIQVGGVFSPPEATHASNVDARIDRSGSKLCKFTVDSLKDDGLNRNFYDFFFQQFPNIKKLEHNSKGNKMLRELLLSKQVIILELESVKLYRKEYLDEDLLPGTRKALKTFMEGIARTVKHLYVEVAKKPVDLVGAFAMINNPQMITIDVRKVDLMTFGSGSYDQLLHVTIDHQSQSSYDFFEKMPILRTIKYDPVDGTNPKPSVFSGQACSTVVDITFTHAIVLEKCANLLQLLPSVKSVTLHDRPLFMMDYLRGSLLRFPELLEAMSKSLPALSTLKLFGPCGMNRELYPEDDDATFDDYGNVCLGTLERLVSVFPELQVFDHTDDLDRAAKEVEIWEAKEIEDARIEKEYRARKRMRGDYDIPRNSDYEDSSSADSESDTTDDDEEDQLGGEKVLSQRVGYGKEAVDLLLSLTNLRVLRLQRAVMTQSQLTLLQNKLSVLDVKELHVHG